MHHLMDIKQLPMRFIMIFIVCLAILLACRFSLSPYSSGDVIFADDFSEKLIQILGQSSFPLSTRELATRLRLRQVRLPDYEVSRRLRAMGDEGVLLYKKGRWSALATRLR